MEFQLRDKTVVFVGGTGPLGVPMARALAEAGARVALVARNEARLQETLEILRESGVEADAFVADVTSEQAMAALANTLQEKYEAIGVLVNAAASASGKSIETLTLADWDRSLASTLNACFLCTKHLGELMKLRGGSIINVGSIYGVVSADPRIYPPGMAGSSIDYAAGKSGLLGLTRYVAIHWARHQIRCNLLTVGGVESERNENPAFREAYAARTPLGRMAQAQDVLGALVFLASDASAYMTGQNVIIDGGWTAW